MRTPARGLCRLAAVAVLWAAAVPAGADAILAVDRDQVNIREDATVQSPRIAVLQRGEEVEELVRHGDWVQVLLPDGRTGWVHHQLLQERLIVVGQGVRVRSTPASGGAPVTMLSRGQEVGMVGERGNWCQVRLDDGRTGWVYTQYVRHKTAADLAAPEPEEPPEEPVEPATARRPEQPAAAGGREPEQPVPVRAQPEPAPPEELPAAVQPEPAAVAMDSITLVRSPYVAGLQHEAAGEAQAALERFEEVLAGEPDNVNALFHAAKALRQLGRYDEALAALYRALEISGGRRDLYLTLGEVYRQLGGLDSAARYQALFRGQEPPAAAPVAGDAGIQEEVGEAIPLWGRDLPVLHLAAAAGLLVFLMALGVWWVRRSPAAPEPAAERRRGRAAERFGRSLERSAAAAREGRITPEEESALDRQIEDKWQELRQSTTPFARPGRTGVEEEGLNRILDQLETLRGAVDQQDERARLYAEILRLQNMKIESLKEEVRLLRGRRR